MSLLYIENAAKNVTDYTATAERDGVIEDSQKAVDCMDCEAFIQFGINAFQWVMQADEKIREAVYEEKIEYDETVDEAIFNLVKEWLRPVNYAEKWISRCQHNGFVVENLTLFRECVAEARAIVQYDPEKPMPEALADLRDQALREHRDGQTAEMFSEAEQDC